jgi:hypothetical protein
VATADLDKALLKSALEEALAEAIREGEQTRRASREEVFRILRGRE